MTDQSQYTALLERLGIGEEHPGATDGEEWFGSGDLLEVVTPIDNTVIAKVRQATEEDYDRVVKAAEEAFKEWRMVPAPKRGEIIRQLNLRIREKKKDLGDLIALEMGKISEEGAGEIQEVIDIADFAVGLSRQLYGLSMHSERPGHRMMEQWHPLGVVGVVTAFNFPCAPWSWNSMVASVCGDTTIWKPSSKTPLCAIALVKLANDVFKENGYKGIMNLVVGPGRSVGQKMLDDRRVPLVSATGSCSMGYKVYESVAKRMGRAILELGGNNAIIVTGKADLDMATRAIVFGAVGTAGQRCTSTRRIIVHESVREDLENRLVSAYKQLKIGNPLEKGTHVGPVIDETAITAMQEAIEGAKKEGGELLIGGERMKEVGDNYVRPAIMRIGRGAKIVSEETFAPLLYVIPYEGDVHEAISINNEVPQGLSSAIFTTDIRESEAFLSHRGSDCGIANVNIGTSGAEIGGAFGGEKETGGGRESGSDAWKQYMRRQTCTINYTNELPLAQGIEFNLE